MDLQEFIQQFADALDIDDASTLSGNTEFRELDEWSSLAGLSVISMIDDEYDVTLNGKDIRSASTIEDLFKTVEAKK